MSSETLHETSLSEHTLNMHRAIRSVMEELEAVDWYRQRAEATKDEQLKKIVLHNAREEIEHACMVIEWLRRNDKEFDEQLRKYLFSEGEITEVEERAKAPRPSK